MLHTIAQFAAEESVKEEVEGIAQLGIDPIQIVLQLGTFLVLFLIISKFGLSRITASLKAREDRINESLKNAQDVERQKAETDRLSEETLKKARQEADDIIANSHEEAGSIVTEAQARATAQADDIVAKAQAKAEAEADKVRSDLKGEIVELVSDATEIVLDEKIDESKDQALIKKAIERGAQS